MGPNSVPSVPHVPFQVINFDPQSSPPQVLAATIHRKKQAHPRIAVGSFLSRLVAAGIVCKDFSTTSPTVS